MPAAAVIMAQGYEEPDGGADDGEDRHEVVAGDEVHPRPCLFPAAGLAGPVRQPAPAIRRGVIPSSARWFPPLLWMFARNAGPSQAPGLRGDNCKCRKLTRFQRSHAVANGSVSISAGRVGPSRSPLAETTQWIGWLLFWAFWLPCSVSVRCSPASEPMVARRPGLLRECSVCTRAGGAGDVLPAGRVGDGAGGR